MPKRENVKAARGAGRAKRSPCGLIIVKERKQERLNGIISDSVQL